ncbi:F0F1 ATP synthase subunit A [Candidatus Auribacterota bacterium]
MEGIGTIPKIALFGLEHWFFTLNYVTILTSLFIMGLLILFAVTVTKKLTKIPGRYQNIAEMLIAAFDQLTHDTLGKEFARKYFPLIMTLFLFILLCNWIVVFPIPHFIHIHWNQEPTADVNTTLALGTIVFFVVHYSGIKVKGIKSYIWDYFEPAIEIKNIKIPNILMFPLNVIGEIAKVVSLSFRLFGNIMGGGIIFIVVSHLTKHLFVPILLNAFFVFFVGTVQAFVFAMLALTYIAVAISD